jgi:hypothetical protein
MMRAVDDGDTSADGITVQHDEEVEAQILDAIHHRLVELEKQRDDRLSAAIETVVDQLIDELSAEGFDADQYELSAMAYGAWTADERRFGPLPEIQTLLEFIGTATAAGIIGNLAYDALKGVARQLASRRHSGPVTEALEAVVLFAVADMCRRFQLHVDPSKLRVRQWQLSSAYAVAKIDAKGSELTAEVTVPYDSWRTYGVNVRIRDVSQSDEIAQAAESLYERVAPRVRHNLKKRRERDQLRSRNFVVSDPDFVREDALEQWRDAEWAQIVSAYDKEKYKLWRGHPRF